ncbi:hypothetical protein HMPREF1990_02196 [Porphyromonas gingivalis W4087]|nr:hypothetical protein HMPREF1553_00435 [Porphyromonas gingivalis F0568]ERJ85633.1 hypothetical protein HMPREF1990_02196 [Porphyromonas gingivalis W4087]
MLSFLLFFSSNDSNIGNKRLVEIKGGSLCQTSSSKTNRLFSGFWV